ncbi:MAG: diaminopimelate epimerase [Alphaproteobacteria bacterium]|nr:diaminopimelate epimerase [Alphaproteobacteria bacterium]
MHLDRYHGLGNDYLVLVDGPPLSPDLVRAICDRHTGVGSDGILAPAEPIGADFGVRIWNPDGSVAEKSGNGLRIYARWLVDAGLTLARRFTVDTGPCHVACEVGTQLVTVAMGTASFVPADVPVLADGPMLDGLLEGIGRSWRVCAVGLGNPHCVLFVDQDPDTLPWRTWGEALERHARFPRRTNVQVARVLGSSRIEARIWERGAGPTQASGSSACAVAAAAVKTGRIPAGDVEIAMPGGMVRVAVGADLSLSLEGPVERVGRVDVDPHWLSARLA